MCYQRDAKGTPNTEEAQIRRYPAALSGEIFLLAFGEGMAIDKHRYYYYHTLTGFFRSQNVIPLAKR